MDDKTVSLKEVIAEIDAMPPVKAEGHEFVEKTCLKTRIGLLPSAQPTLYGQRCGHDQGYSAKHRSLT